MTDKITNDQAFEASGFKSRADFDRLSPVARLQYARRAAHPTHVTDHEKLERIRLESALKREEDTAREILAMPEPRFRGGEWQRARATQGVADRIAGIRRRLDELAPSS